MQYIFENELELQEFAANFAKQLHKGTVITLTGPVGAGKTSFCRSLICSFFGRNLRVTSPTYNILQQYNDELSSKPTIYHFDLYRVKNAEELFELGFYEACEQGICLIEWPEIAEQNVPSDAIKIKLEIPTPTQRICKIT